MEVHPPEHPIHTWRDFFIHIATIVVGLLIAIGLEQTVEWLHHRHELTETREALEREREGNIESYRHNVQKARTTMAILQNDLRVLQYLKAHPGAPASELPGVLMWSSTHSAFSSTAWHSAQQTNVVSYMKQDEVEKLGFLYSVLKASDDAHMEYWDALTRATSYRFLDPDPTHMSPAQIDREMELMQAAVAKHYSAIVLLVNMHQAFADFSPSFTNEELDELEQKAEEERLRTVAGPAYERTRELLRRVDAGTKKE